MFSISDRKRSSLVAAMAMVVLAAGPVPRALAEDYADWGKSATLYLRTTPEGANVTGTVTDFPVLIRLTAAVFPFAQAKGRGQDVRFSAADGTHLRYQIDRWDSAHGLAEAWVKVKSLQGNAVDSLTLRWGNAGASDSSNGNAVFDSSQGFVGVWHLGESGTGKRKNAVLGGADGEPLYYDGGESVAGVIGLADSLDGGTTGDNLQIGDGYDNLSDGFTFSIWCYPTSAANSSALFDLGNGPGLDELVLHRSGTSQSIVFDNYRSNVKGNSTKVDNCFPINQWQQFAVTVAGTKLSLYRNGSLIASDDTAGNAITSVRRAFNYLGRNDWAAGLYFQGMLDEPQLSRTARSADWIKLAYANQNAAQTLVSLTKPAAPTTCKPTFTLSADTTASEGSTVVLKGRADCATAFNWSAVSGPAPRILDPEAKDLQVFLPRIAKDTTLIYRLSVSYPDSDHFGEVKVGIRADIPDPIFTLPAKMDWNGADSLLIKPEITNLAAILASKQPDVHFSWVMVDMQADTSWRKDGLMLMQSAAAGDFALNVCADNNGPATCKSLILSIQVPTGLKAALKPGAAPVRRSGYDAVGRRLTRSGAGAEIFATPAVYRRSSTP